MAPAHCSRVRPTVAAALACGTEGLVFAWHQWNAGTQGLPVRPPGPDPHPGPASSHALRLGPLPPHGLAGAEPTPAALADAGPALCLARPGPGPALRRPRAPQPLQRAAGGHSREWTSRWEMFRLL